MKYELKHYTEDKGFIDKILTMMRDHAIERLGANNYAPDTAKILGLWKLGVLRLITMCDDSGKLVGYQGWLCSNQLTNISLKQAIMSYIFIDKSARGTEEQFETFVQYGIDAMKILGQEDILFGVDGDQQWLLEKLGRMGFTTVRATQLSYKV
jgi:hypothetical protein